MNKGKINTFTDLLAWQEGHKLVILLYTCTKHFPYREAYSLTDQMRRAVTSITSNIAEGFGRQGYKEKYNSTIYPKDHLMNLKISY
jgi:four helix bundle protein